VVGVTTQAPEQTGGPYTLLIQFGERAWIEVGALGDVEFPAGWYAYTGSALGPGGFARVERHREIATGERETRHWHVDYLLGHPAASVDLVTTAGGVDAECDVANRLEGERIPTFGASDCDCPSHLVHRLRRDELVASVAGAHAEVDRTK
jgi:Uri superfamily endonuclease